METLKHFKATGIFTIVALILAFLWGMFHGPNAGLDAAINVLVITTILGIMELSLSFDNAVVNASILKHWDPFWQKIFLTVGILIAVFGMRLVFPIVIVALTADLGYLEVIKLALNDPTTYSAKLMENHSSISAFGGIFLWLVFAGFLFNNERDLHWLGKAEKWVAKLGEINGIGYVTAIAVLLGLSTFVPQETQHDVFISGVWGIIVFALVDVIGWFLEQFTGEDEEEGEGNAALVKGTVKAGLGGFLYLELLDASFSFDGVIGAFAITSDVVIIMLGLAIGAMAVRCMTVYLVRQGTLDNYRYLEHGAMYAIGVLALILLSSSFFHLPEVVVGLIGVAFIVASFIHSIHANKKDAQQVENGS